MPTFIYSGDSSSITISGTHVVRGIPTELVGHAASKPKAEPAATTETVPKPAPADQQGDES